MIAKGIAVNPKKAEKIRRYLFKNELLRTDLKIKKDNEFVYIPIIKLPKELNSYMVMNLEFEKVKEKVSSYKEILSIPDKLKNDLPTSYDIIGDILLIKLDNSILLYKKEIGKALLKTNKNIKSVYLTKPVKGELRTRELDIIAGENRTKTTHIEYGLRFNLDISKTYFSPRLATERKRIANIVKPGETIVDMFAGVAPFSIMIAKYANPKIVYALDKNKYAIEYAKQNIKLNNLLDKIEVINTDAKNVYNLLSQKGIKVDRIIMNLPFSSHLFFKYTLKIIANHSKIHYYNIIKKDEIKKRIDNLRDMAKQYKILLSNLNIRKIKTYAPREFYIGIDITAKKHADVA